MSLYCPGGSRLAYDRPHPFGRLAVPFAWSQWFYPTSVSVSSSWWVSLASAYHSAAHNGDWDLELEGNGTTTRLRLWTVQAGAWGPYTEATVAVVADRWQHAFFQVDASGNVELYLDGAARDTGADLAQRPTTDYEYLRFAGSGAYYVGDLFHCSAWYGALLSQQQIRALARGVDARTINRRYLASHWQMPGGEGVVRDEIGGRHLTLGASMVQSPRSNPLIAFRTDSLRAADVRRGPFIETSNGVVDTDGVSTISLTLSRSNKLIALVGIGYNPPPNSVNAPTWNGTAMTYINTSYSAVWGQVFAYYLDDPATGTHDLTFDWSSVGSQTGLVGVGLIDAETGAPAYSGNGNDSDNGGVYSVTSAGSAAGDLLLGVNFNDGAAGFEGRSGTSLFEANNIAGDSAFGAQWAMATGANAVLTWDEIPTLEPGASAVIAIGPATTLSPTGLGRVSGSGQAAAQGGKAGVGFALVSAGPRALASGSAPAVQLFIQLDETSPNDADFITTTTVGAYYECGLSTVGNPGVDTSHIVRVRAKGAGAVFKVGVYQNTTLIEEWTETLTDAWATYSHTLAQANVANITSYSSLRLRLTVL